DAANASTIQLGALQPRCTDRLRYTYNFYANWVHEIRVEAILPIDPRRPYPWCRAGARAAPPGACRGPQEFLALRQHYHLLRVVDELIACLRPDDPAARVVRWDEDELDADDEDEDGIDREARFEELRYWLLVDHFDRRALNRRLRTLSCPPKPTEKEAIDAGSDSGPHH
ncbi:MAG: plasmid pRiA4b ORF-3 family protein, partial [Chloroflexota bacterium]|nr:plasmid pRiA4b ORF-3 family protein [Chloroflexota bacterium]